MRSRHSARTIVAVLAISAAAVATVQAQAGEKELFIYSIVNQEESQLFADLFKQKTGVQVSFLRASTGELVNRVIAEKGGPKADILLGGPSSLHISAADAGALAAYRSPAAAQLPAYAKDPAGYWTGFYVTVLGIGVNEERFKQKFGSTPLPATWDDLANPKFKGEIVLTDPAASSTAYLFVQTQLQRLGWDAGWAYLAKLAPLVGQFPSSGGAPPQLVGTGEYAIGVAYIHALATYREKGFPLRTIVPPKTSGELGAVSVIAGGPDPVNARRFVDFVLSSEAQAAFVKLSLTAPLNPAVALPAGAPGVKDIDLIDYDAKLAGDQRDKVLAQWKSIVK
jgi:iron(III) transport system substrate-binding protein